MFELPLKPLTVIVGPNASGKSNILSGLALLRNLMVFEKPPSVEAIQNSFWAGGRDQHDLPIAGKSGGNPDGIRPSAFKRRRTMWLQAKNYWLKIGKLSQFRTERV